MHEPGVSWAIVVATVSEIDAALNKWLSQHHGLGLTDFRALALLSAVPDRELRISELAGRVGLNQSSATRLVARLESKGFTSRDTCPDDGRGVYAVITEPGLALVREGSDSYSERLASLLASTGATHPETRRAFQAITKLLP